jgi:hypothetical protein
MHNRDHAFLDDLEFEGNLSSSAFFCNLAQTMEDKDLTTSPACQVMLIQATLDLPSSLPRGAELTVDFNITAGEINKLILGSGRKHIECVTHFYKGTRLLERICRPVDFDPVDCSLRGVSLGSTFWASLIPRLVPKLRAETWDGDKVSGRDRVSMELKALNAVQQIYIDEAESKRQLLILCWHFELAENGRLGELFWRNVVFSRSTVESDSLMSNGDFMVGKSIFRETEFNFNDLDIPLPGSVESIESSFGSYALSNTQVGYTTPGASDPLPYLASLNTSQPNDMTFDLPNDFRVELPDPTMTADTETISPETYSGFDIDLDLDVDTVFAQHVALDCPAKDFQISDFDMDFSISPEFKSRATPTWTNAEPVPKVKSCSPHLQKSEQTNQLELHGDLQLSEYNNLPLSDYQTQAVVNVSTNESIVNLSPSQSEVRDQRSELNQDVTIPSTRLQTLLGLNCQSLNGLM